MPSSNTVINLPRKNQPQGLYILSIIEMWDRFSFYGSHTLLILYLTKMFSFTDAKSFAFLGLYTAISFITPVVGGFLGDRVLGFRLAITLGMIGMIVGNLILTLKGLNTLYIGLAVLVCGAGLVKSCTPSLLGNLYDKDDPKLDGGFTLFYMAMNIGALAGPILYGILLESYGWHAGFLLSAIGTTSSLIWFIATKEYFKNKSNIDFQSNNIRKFIAATFVTIIIIAVLFNFPIVSNVIVSIISLLIVLIIIKIAIKSEPTAQRHIIALVILSILSLFYFSGNLQTDSSLTLFIERHVNRHIWHWHVPVMVFSAFEAISVIILSPLFIFTWNFLARIKREPSIGLKVAIGLLFAAFSFWVFAATAKEVYINHHWVTIAGIILGNLFLAAGELCILPMVTAAVAQYAPNNLRGTLMGLWFMSNAMAGFVSTLMAQSSDVSHLKGASITNTSNYVHTFNIIAIIMLAVCVVTLILLPTLKKLLKT